MIIDKTIIKDLEENNIYLESFEYSIEMKDSPMGNASGTHFKSDSRWY